MDDNSHRYVMIDAPQKYLLSICTPTYNRAELFKKSLEVLLPQIYQFKDKVSMHISDNASTDNTERMIKDLAVKYDVMIDYYKQTDNVGLERNYSKAVSMSDGRYTYVLCDDDILAPNYLQTIIAYLDSDEEYALLHFNWLHADENYNILRIQNPIYSHTPQIPVDVFWQKCTANPNFSSAVVFNSKVWNMGVCKGEYDGDGYWGFARLLKGSCLFKKNCIYHHFPLVIERSAGRSYQPLNPYYQFVVMSKIFNQNSQYIPGVLEFWKSALNNATFLLKDMYLNTKFYREHRAEMKEYLSKEQLKLYDRIINARYPQTVYNKWIMINRIKTISKKVYKYFIS